MPTNHGDFFEDMLIEILSRLSVRSLLRFRCVCKSWYDLFESPNFISKHLKNEDNMRLFVRYIDSEGDGSDEYPKICFSLFLDETLADLSSQDLVPQMPILGVVRGPFDGIFCSLVNSYRIAIWNLATRECKALPKRASILPDKIQVSNSYVGFGLDPISNCYKLVWILTLWDEKRCILFEFTHIAVYTFSTNSWRDFQSSEMSQYNLCDELDSTYHDGACYWLAMRYGHEVVLSFYMDNEAFQELHVPCILENTAPKFLGVCNDSLCLLLFDADNSCFDIWIMKERYWTKQMTTRPIVAVDRPIGFWKNGTFFIRTNMGQLVLYDPSTQEIRDLELGSCEFSTYIYRESLITLKAKDNLFDCLNKP